ncbi:GGDEF domain-containing protein [Paenibacillus sp. SYP-B4298]|uniref:GGDEF domain-containing protein n=1 Tax=Paenibacillus sp. SYP-B4298 TaxID=2996034 RepID=UPI0022DE6DF6|nr:GGDEF domain-containing protein [Paenibacillus sp. SYP-B4298]
MKKIRTQIGEIAEPIPVVAPETNCDAVYQLFKQQSNLEGVAVVGKNGAVSLMMRGRFFQEIGTRYGFNLYMGRPIGLVMDRQPLVVDSSAQITDVSLQAMERTVDKLYDLVLVMSQGVLLGAVTIRGLLLAVADVRAEMARFLNPLTGLPGNRMIDDRLQQLLQLDCFSVLYIDLDQFKAYNDSYGFNMGDQMIQATASLLREQFPFPETFLGHIGGDDFIAILTHHQFEEVAQRVMTAFEQMKKEFYSSHDLDHNYVLAEGRSGVSGPIPLVTVSIAAVTNARRSYATINEIAKEAARIKKVCKSIQGSCLCDNEGIV